MLENIIQNFVNIFTVVLIITIPMLFLIRMTENLIKWFNSKYPKNRKSKNN